MKTYGATWETSTRPQVLGRLPTDSTLNIITRYSSHHYCQAPTFMQPKAEEEPETVVYTFFHVNVPVHKKGQRGRSVKI